MADVWRPAPRNAAEDYLRGESSFAATRPVLEGSLAKFESRTRGKDILTSWTRGGFMLSS